MKYRTAIITFFIISGALFAYTNENKVAIDWSKGYISAHTVYSAKYDDSGTPVDYTRTPAGPARGRNVAYEKARSEAVEQITWALRSLEVEPGVMVRDVLETNAGFAEKFGDLLNDRIRSREHPGDYYGAVCDARFRISDLIRALPYEYPMSPFPSLEKNPLATEYTSLIVDARDEAVIPMIFPSVYDEDGLEIYGRRFINIATAVRKGVVSYCTDEAEAKAHPKAGEHPYFTTALRSSRGLPVISHRDVRKVLSHKKTVENLRECRVIFIIRKKSVTGTL